MAEIDEVFGRNFKSDWRSEFHAGSPENPYYGDPGCSIFEALETALKAYPRYPGRYDLASVHFEYFPPEAAGDDRIEVWLEEGALHEQMRGAFDTCVRMILAAGFRVEQVQPR